jgi:putative transposase
MRQKRAYRYRCHPTPEQASVLARTFSGARFVYNWALRLRPDAYYERQERVSYANTSAALTLLKREPATAWLNEVSSVPPQPALRHLDRAFRNFFEGHAKYPGFHKQYGAQAAEYTTSAFCWDAASHCLTLAKMDAPLPIRWSRPLPGGAQLSTVTVSRDAASRSFVSLLVEEEIAPLPPVTPAVGLDPGLQDAVVLDTGEKVGNPRFFHRDAHRLAKAQRRLAKKQPGSKNRAKARRKVARLYARIADRRRDFLQQLSTRLIRENQTICSESLHVKALLKHPTLAQAIHDVGWGELVRQLTYKAAWYGRTLVAVDTWYPSSKRCSACGHVLGSLSLDTRRWTCPECASIHDRDVNAATTVLAARRAVSACGEAIRPGRGSSRRGTPC